MKYLIIAGSLLLSTVAFAQEADKKFNLEVSGADITLLGEALGMLPYGKVAPLMQKLQVQINAQQQPSAPNPVPEKK
jgi:hypothetical protein